jgi:hypothetical protein
MKYFAVVGLFLLGSGRLPAEISFRVQEFETTFKVGTAVVTADVNADGRPDIVVADANRVVWYENPTWRRHTMIGARTPPDNVCIAPCDIDGDGRLDFFLGAGWQPTNTKTAGTIHWLQQGQTPTDEWALHDIGAEPTTHRMRVADFDGTGKPQLLVAPLQGRDTSAKRNWVDGRPVRLLKYAIPADPIAGPWTPEVVDESLFVVHNVWPVAAPGGKLGLLCASYEGVTELTRHGRNWMAKKIHAGNQANPDSNRGASEVKTGTLGPDLPIIATIEPWHGNQVVVYERPSAGDWKREVIDEKLRWGHAVWCADLDGDGADEVIIGVRDDLSKEPGERRGVRVYTRTGGKWTRQIVDEGSVAVEDLTVCDLDGDGRAEIIAVGRQTGNGRIYWNLGRK